MLTDDQLKKLLADLEADNLERTLTTNKTDKFAEAVCAFANDFPNHRKPGYLLVGVDDEGKPGGLRVTDDLLKNLAGLRSDGNIQPIPALTVGKYSLEGGEVAVVEVQPADLPPVRYKGKVWIRIGPRRGTATEQEERILTERRLAKARSFDALPCLDATLDDLSSELFILSYLKHAVSEEVIAENNRSLQHQLASLRLFDLTADCPTNAGVLLLAGKPTHFLHGGYVQFVRYDGIDMTANVQVDKQATGDLRHVLQTLDLLIDVNTRQHPVFVSTLREEMAFDYPRVAVRELLLNAVMHRNYQSNAPIRFFWFTDHIEIHSPGGLYGEVSPENFPNAVDYRNPVVAEAMRVLGYANRFGRGVMRAERALSINGNPPARFTFNPNGVSVRVDQPIEQRV